MHIKPLKDLSVEELREIAAEGVSFARENLDDRFVISEDSLVTRQSWDRYAAEYPDKADYTLQAIGHLVQKLIDETP
jgi:hypothetical protein